jgi:predicted O-methyltransferase YrrM
MKRFIKRKLIVIIEELSMFLFYNLNNTGKTFYEIEKINYKESAEFIYNNCAQTALLDNIEAFWKTSIDQIPSSGYILEFGVFQGASTNFFSKCLQKNGDKRILYGFDSFEGLSEDWSGTNLLKETFDLKGVMPKVNNNVKLIKGWIDDTLPVFVEKNINKGDKVAFMHIDMDTYTPTKVIFENMVDHIKEGTIIVFDELLGYPGWKANEYKALIEIIKPKWEYEFLVFCEPKFKYQHKYQSVYISECVRATIKIKKRID